MQTKNLATSKFRLQVVLGKAVDVRAAKAFIVKRYGAEDVTTVFGSNQNTLSLSARPGNLSSLHRYFQKKRGVQTVQISK